MKKLLIIASLMAMGPVASASTLYWQLDQTAQEQATTLVSPEVWEYAVLCGTTGQQNIGGTEISSINRGDLTADAIDNWESYTDSYTSFYVELRDSANTRLGATDLVSASALNEYTYSGGMSTPSASSSAYAFSGFQTGVVPEPTSGLLVLFGMMALGLKRKRA